MKKRTQNSEVGCLQPTHPAPKDEIFGLSERLKEAVIVFNGKETIAKLPNTTFMRIVVDETNRPYFEAVY